jgi:hypothetical protein
MEKLPARSAASTAATATSAAAAATAATAPLRAGPSFVDHQRTPTKVGAIQGRNRLLGLIGISHLDERETAGLSSVTISYQVNGSHFAVHRERIANLIFVSRKGKVAYVKSFRHRSS